jgi:hypothetical protein
MKNIENQELDELTEDLVNETEENGGEEYPQDHRRIFTDKLDPPISSLFQEYKDGDLILDPIFQRRPVWDHPRGSKLIESVLLEVPIPVFYFAESPDGTKEVIDGQQRLRAFFDFLDNKYELKGLKAISEINGKSFKELDKPIQKQIKNYSVRTITFKKESDENLRFEIFERLNTGAVPLNDQELRNCIYRGPYNQLLIELASDPDYMFLMGLKAPEKRMRDVEFVLRFAAFYHSTYLKYKPSMARFLNEDMQTYQKLTRQQASELRQAFKNSVTLIRSLLAQNAFKRYYRGDSKSPHGRWETKKFNAALFDVLMYTFANVDKNQVMASLDAIREALIVLMTENQDFIDSIELSTSGIRMVRQRFDLWRMTLESILSTTSKQPRCFTRALKLELFMANPTCQICGQQINDADDAAVDHVEMYWLGGKTIPENARLTHRYCNWARAKSTR